MIYLRPATSEPLAQGDILYPLPSPAFDLENSPIIRQDGADEVRPWIDVTDPTVDAEVSVRRTWGILGSQDCNIEHAELVTFFEVGPVADVARMAVPSEGDDRGWAGFIGKELRKIPRMFYLPKWTELGIESRMAVDLERTLQVPTSSLRALYPGLRKARLNPIALEHFRHAISNYFTRYAYDEWYPMTQAEVEAYQARYGETVSRYEWQLGPG
jgi:hypothetical protein